MGGSLFFSSRHDFSCPSGTSLQYFYIFGNKGFEVQLYPVLSQQLIEVAEGHANFHSDKRDKRQYGLQILFLLSTLLYESNLNPRLFFLYKV